MALSPVTVRLLEPSHAAALSESGRLARSPGPPPPRTETQRAKIESGRLDRSVGRTRIMPFDLVLASAHGSTPIFSAGAFDELRLFQREVTTRHDTEWVQRAAPGDLRRERYQPFGLFRLLRGRGEEVPELTTSPALVRRLRDALGAAGLLAARRFLALGREGEQRLERRGADRALLEAARARLDDRQRIAWMESAFGLAPEGDRVVHRYYTGSHLELFVVRHDAQGKRLFAAEMARAARDRGLIVYLNAA